jgi:lipopolysaccharide/colanic/teichoic acid biosynthesis glycosyltransferase
VSVANASTLWQRINPKVNDCVTNRLPAVSTTTSPTASLAVDLSVLDRHIQALAIHQQVHHSTNSKGKRLLDILGALVGLALATLLAIPIAIAIVLDNPGPIFYSQIRCGVKGRTFRIWKFRSMLVEADRLKHLVENQATGHIFKNSNDPRITRVGRFLRRSSLDELPQFWNVLVGDMSLVGPRPPTVEEVIKYEKHHWGRLNTKPGMTGEWQAHGRSRVTDFEDIVRMDLAYQQKWSIAYDLLLILKTLMVVVSKDGAY